MSRRFGLVLGLLGCASLSAATLPASAQEASLQFSLQAGQSAGILHMPHGDHAGGFPHESTNLETPRLSPTPALELRRLKGLRGESAAASPVDAPQPKIEAIYRECVTNVATGFTPSDIHGAAGPTNLVVVTNVDIGIYSKSTCAIVSRVALRSFFGAFSIPSTETLFDPRVLYDRLSGRCLVVVESRNSTNTDQFLYVAGSTNSACTSWRRVRFTLSRVSPSSLFCKEAASDFYDYPNAGYNTRRLVVTANNFRTNNTVYGALLSIDKTALYGTATVFASCFRSGVPFNLAPAVVGDSNASMFLLSSGSGAGSSLQRLRLTTSTSGVSSDTLTFTSSIAVPAWSAPPDAVQPNGQRLDSLDGRFQSASKQLGTLLWNVHAVNVNGFSRWRMYKLSTTGTGVLFSRTPTTSTCANADHLFNPSIDTNSTSTTALAFVTTSRTCPSQATTGRAAHLVFQGQNSSNTGWVFNSVETSTTNYATDGFGVSCNNTARGSCRWGDYSSTQIDPSNTARAWGFNQLVTGSTQFNWNTRGAQVGP